ncbi:MAG: NADH-ubiquinone oxidoreductase-F iron-sulfur binding region domain-containing protein, partial [Verrucomicrobiota bacterium]|nr:NADH-ubiquinone oxidoreductase-F iron-sulfur binding region domain-containing protein [Verrucomicrobiota bacterium]
MDFDSLMACGSMSGSGGVIVMDDTTDMVEALANINYFYAHESCGQCTPCREGVPWMRKVTARMCAGQAREEDADLLMNIADQIAGRTICAFGEAASWPVQSFIEKFKDEFIQKAREQASQRNEAKPTKIETTLI